MNFMREEDITALFDMDGTLCNHDKALQIDYNLIKSPEDPPLKPFDFNTPGYINERIKLIRNQVGWWENLERLQIGFDILEIAKELGFNIRILTKGPSSSKNAYTEKSRWVDKNIGENTDFMIVKDKSIVYGRVLVDDYPLFLDSWLKNRPRGIAIMPAHEYNESYSHDRVTRYNGKNIEEVKKVLEWARNRRANS